MSTIDVSNIPSVFGGSKLIIATTPFADNVDPRESCSMDLVNSYRGITSEIPRLTNNDIEQIGINHNYILNLAVIEMSKTPGIPSLNEVKGIFRNIEIPNLEFTDPAVELNWKNYFMDNSIISENELPVPVRNAYYEMLNIFSSSNNYNEVEIQINNSLADVESLNIDYVNKDLIKVMLTVGKYSAKFWFPENLGGDGIGYAFLVNKGVLDIGDDIQALSIAQADAIGAAGGMLQWVGAAILGGPVGVAGFIGGALFGAGFASAVEWLD